MKPIRILGISGSLRSDSSTHTVLRNASTCFPASVVFTFYDSLGALPHFNDSPYTPPEVADLRKQLQEADGVLLCTPEYAFGVPGSLKNALDWTVSTGEFVNKPLALITAATGGQHAHAALLLIFKALSAALEPEATLLVPFIRAKMNAQRELTDPATLANIRKVASALIATIEKSGTDQ